MLTSPKKCPGVNETRTGVRHRTGRIARFVARTGNMAVSPSGNISRQRLAVTITALVSVSGSCGMTASSTLRHTSSQLGMTSFGRLHAKRSPSGKATSAALHPTSVAITSMSGAAAAGDTHQHKKERERTKAEPRRLKHEADSQHSHENAQAKLQPGTHRLRNETGDAADSSRHAKREEERTHQEAGGGDFARMQAVGQDHRRDRLHRLDRQRQAVE
jgi:hypothetical protein